MTNDSSSTTTFNLNTSVSRACCV